MCGGHGQTTSLNMHRYTIAVIFAFNLLDLAAAHNDCRPKDCYDLKCYKVSKAKDGPHTIYPDTPDLTNFSLQVSCDQETDGGGWIMYMRRLNGTVDFTRNWDDYKRGFGENGDNMTELWLGNENVYQVLQSYGTTECELRIEMDAWDETERWLVASNFRMNNETSKYTLNWDDVIGPYPEIYSNWNYHKLLEFRTNDSENPHCVGSVDQYTGGWWYECSSLFLTGKYVNEEVKTYKSISVVDSKHGYPLKRARLMLRPTNDNRSCDNPCKNGGTCEHVADPIGHHCACTSEWCGSTCEVKNPCKNGGKCVAEQLPMGDYGTYCVCTSEWCGSTCDVKNPCKNGGKCETVEDPMGDNRTYCACSSKWCGATCEVIDPCNNGGKCEAEQLPMGDYGTYCACSSEWCGPTCDVKNPCKNGGVCEVDAITKTATCNCDADFIGPTCEDVRRDDVGGEFIVPLAMRFDDMIGADMTGEDATGEDMIGADMTGEDMTGEDMTGEDMTGEDMTGEDMTGEYTSDEAEDLTGDDTSDEDMTGDDIIREDTTRGDSNREDTTGDEPEPAAYGASSAACVTTNGGVIVALLILRRRLFGFFGL